MRALTPRLGLLAALTLALVACGTPDEAATSTSVDAPPPTLGGVGQLPDPIEIEQEPLVLATVPPPPTGPDGVTIEPVSELVLGNRLLVIGDSIMTSASTRYTGALCDALVPLGWAVAVDAEPGRFVEFGNRVLDRRLDGGEQWDAAVVHLGTNYRGDQEEYREELTEILDRLSPRPIVLFTVTEYRPEWSEVNEVVREMEGRYENVIIVDWETISSVPGVLTSDRLHPGQQGIRVLADSTAAAIGSVPLQEGICLDSPFRDDSQVGDNQVLASTRGTGSSSSGSSRSGSSGSGGSSSGGSSPSPESPAPTDPPQPEVPVETDPPVTDPPVTQPPATQPPPPPVTQPPATQPPPPEPTDPPADSGTDS